MNFGWIAALAGLTLVTLAIAQGTNELALICTIVFFPAALTLYFSPSIVAHLRKHPSETGIFILNLLLGVTVVGWVGALVWAYSPSPVREDVGPSVEPDFAPISGAADVKDCPFCAEPIKLAAIKCRHCGSMLPSPDAA